MVVITILITANFKYKKRGLGLKTKSPFLYIIQNRTFIFIDLHEGTIFVESDEGEETTFTITIPLNA